MRKRICLVILCICVMTVSLFAQFQQGDTELTLMGTMTHLSGDKDYFQYYSQTIIAITAGFGKFVSQTVQMGIQPTWQYQNMKYEDYDYHEGQYSSRKERSYSDGMLGVDLFTNVNFPSDSKVVPYLTGRLQIADIAPEDGMTIGDGTSLGLGGGLRFFLVENAAINSTLLYSIPLKDAKYKYKTLSLLLGLSMFI